MMVWKWARREETSVVARSTAQITKPAQGWQGWLYSCCPPSTRRRLHHSLPASARLGNSKLLLYCLYQSDFFIFSSLVSKSEAKIKWPILGRMSMFYFQGRLGIEPLAFSTFITVVGSSTNTMSGIQCWAGARTHAHKHTYHCTTSV